MTAIDSLKQRFGVDMDWRWGGGTVMMLRHQHRDSNDIDIFIDDPQYLGCLSPGMNDSIGSMTELYDQQSKFIKLYLPPDGEIDFVVAAPLTPKPFEHAKVNGRPVKLETDLEIVSKKIWYRSESFTGRDFFDLHWLVVNNPGAIPALRQYADKLAHLPARMAAPIVREQYAHVKAIGAAPTFDDAMRSLIGALPELKAPGRVRKSFNQP